MNSKQIILLSLSIITLMHQSIAYNEDETFSNQNLVSNASLHDEFNNRQRIPSQTNIRLRPELQHTINLFWINRNRNLNQKHIFPCKNEEEMIVAYIQPILGWGQQNPDNTILQVWYDGGLIHQTAVDNTQALIDRNITELGLKTPIVLRDLRSIPFIQKNPEILSTMLNVYFRADLLRIIVSLNDILVEGASYSMYTDLDTEPMLFEDLYDKATLKYLEKIGIVLAKAHEKAAVMTPYENNFHILSYHNINLLEAMQLVLVDVNVERAKIVVHKLGRAGDVFFFRDGIFDDYRIMFKYFHYLEGLAELKVFDTDELYLKEKHGLAVFAIDNRPGTPPQWQYEVIPGRDSDLISPIKRIDTPKSLACSKAMTALKRKQFEDVINNYEKSNNIFSSEDLIQHLQQLFSQENNYIFASNEEADFILKDYYNRYVRWELEDNPSRSLKDLKEFYSERYLPSTDSVFSCKD